MSGNAKVPGGDATGAVETLGAGDDARTPLRGILLIFFACFCFSCLDATAKYLSSELPTVQIVWMRFLVHLILALVLFRVWKHPEVLRSDRKGLHFLRGLALLGSTMFNFLAVKHLQLAETMSIFFAAPLVLTALAGPLLGEWAGPRRWAAILIGFIGVLIVVQPGSGELHWAAIYSVLAMLSYASYALMTRMLATTDNVTGMLIVSAAIASLFMMPAGLSAWETPGTAWHWFLLLSTGAWGCLGHWVFIIAHRLAPAPLLAPFIYLQIVWMASLGYLFFGDIPTWTTFLGASIVIASGLFILYREHVSGS